MIFGVHLGDGVDDGALLVNDISGAQRAHTFAAAHLLESPGLIDLQNGALLVGDEVEGQFVFGDEFLMGGGGILADAQHFIAKRKKTLIVVAQVAGLGRAAWGAVLGIEIENELLASEVA